MAGTLACKFWPFVYVQARRDRYGDRFTVHPIDMPPLVFLSSPRDIRAIATAPADVLHAGGGGSLMEPVFGERAFMLHDRGEHASVRDAIMPAFHSRTVRGHTDTIAEVVDREAGSWPVGEAFSLGPQLDRLTLLVMLRVAIVSREPGHEMHDALCRRMLDMLSVMTTPLLHQPRLCHLPGWRRTWRRFLRHRDAVDELVYGLIAQRRACDDRPSDNGFTAHHFTAHHQSGAGFAGDCPKIHPIHRHNARTHGQGCREDLLGLLIAARNPDGSRLSDKQVRDNLVSTIVAGHETTSATLAWTFQLLAHNPAVQDRLIEEIDGGSGGIGDGSDVMGDGSRTGEHGLDGVADGSQGIGYEASGVGDRPIGSDGRLGGTWLGGTYMNAVIQEALRHRPTFLFLPPRVVMRPTEIGGWEYRPPAQLAACTYLLHHDPELYVDPHSFMPERFLEGSPQPGTLLPWGLGRKRCPGRQLALMEIREVLRRVLSERVVLPASPRIARPHWRTALLTPHAGSKVLLRPRRSLGHGLLRAYRDSI